MRAAAQASTADLSQGPCHEWDDPVLRWRALFLQQVCPEQPHLLKAVGLSQLWPLLDDCFAASQLAPPRLLRYRNVFWSRGRGALYDGESGLALPGSFLTRFPRQRQSPHCSCFRVELEQPLSALPAIERCIYLPYSICSNFGHFVTETLAFLWPFDCLAAERLHDVPVILSGCSADEPLAQPLIQWLEQCGGVPVFDVQLPPALHLRCVDVPQPSLRLHASSSTLHLQTAAALAAATGLAAEVVDPAIERVFLSRSGLVGDVRSIVGELELEALLERDGWLVFRPEQAPLKEQLRVYRSARLIAGFEGSAFHGLAFLGPAPERLKVVLLGDCPSPDYFLQFAAQQLDGYVIHCTRLDPDDDIPHEHLRRRLLNTTPQALAEMLNCLPS